MFVNIVQFPPIKASKDSEFQEWFTWSNKELSKQQGFICRRLLKPRSGGNYAAIVEHESYETFIAMHNSPIHNEAYEKVAPLFAGNPVPSFYDVVIG